MANVDTFDDRFSGWPVTPGWLNYAMPQDYTGNTGFNDPWARALNYKPLWPGELERMHDLWDKYQYGGGENIQHPVFDPDASENLWGNLIHRTAEDLKNTTAAIPYDLGFTEDIFGLRHLGKWAYDQLPDRLKNKKDYEPRTFDPWNEPVDKDLEPFLTKPFGSMAPVSEDPFERAAQRTRQAVRPEAGRKQGYATIVPEAMASTIAEGALPALEMGPKLLRTLSALPPELRADPEVQEELNRQAAGTALSFGLMNAPFGAADYGVAGTLARSSQKQLAPLATIADAYHSPLEHFVENHSTQSAPAEQWANTLINAPVKNEELVDNGIIKWLKDRGQEPITRQELAAQIKKNTPQIKAIEKSEEHAINDEAIGDRAQEIMEEEHPDLTPDHAEYYGHWDDALQQADDELRRKGTGTKYGPASDHRDLVTPGDLEDPNLNYRETLLQQPKPMYRHQQFLNDNPALVTKAREALEQANRVNPNFGGTLENDGSGWDIASTAPALREKGMISQDQFEDLMAYDNAKHKAFQTSIPFTHAHWDEPNVLMHYRTTDRELPRQGVRSQDVIEKERQAASEAINATIDREHGDAAWDESLRNSRINHPDLWKRWDDLNNELENSLGESVLHGEEFQSDWHQEGRKQGYKVDPGDIQPLRSQAYQVLEPIINPNVRFIERHLTRNGQFDIDMVTANDVQHWQNEGIITPEQAGIVNRFVAARNNMSSNIPDAPFKKSWHELGFKHFLKKAIDEGKDAVTWTKGNTQIARYNQDVSVDNINYNHTTNELMGMNNGRAVYHKRVQPEDLWKHIGDEHVRNELMNPARKKTLKGPLEGQEYSSLDNNDPALFEGRNRQYPRAPGSSYYGLRIGGSGMRGFYDKIMVDAANKIGKRFGAKVEERTLNEVSPETRAARQELTKLYAEQSDLNRLNSTRTFTPDVFKREDRLKQIYDRIDELTDFLKQHTSGEAYPEVPVHYMKITPAMREAISGGRGFSLYADESSEAPLAAAVAAHERSRLTEQPTRDTTKPPDIGGEKMLPSTQIKEWTPADMVPDERVTSLHQKLVDHASKYGKVEQKMLEPDEEGGYPVHFMRLTPELKGKLLRSDESPEAPLAAAAAAQQSRQRTRWGSEAFSDRLAERSQNQPRVLTDPAGIQRFRDRVAAGATTRQLASEFNIGNSVVDRLLTQEGLKTNYKLGGQPKPEPFMIGSSDKTLDDLRAAREAGKTYKQIAREWNIPQSTVQRAALDKGLANIGRQRGGLGGSRREPSMPGVKGLERPAEDLSPAELEDYAKALGTTTLRQDTKPLAGLSLAWKGSSAPGEGQRIFNTHIAPNIPEHEFIDRYFGGMYNPKDTLALFGRRDLMRGDMLRYEGYLDGGHYMQRTIYPEAGHAYHDVLELAPSAQGSNIAKRILAGQVHVYQNMGINRIDLSANVDIGTYAWAKYGFLPKNWDAFAAALESRVRQWVGQGKITPYTGQELTNVLKIKDPTAIWAFADSTAPVNSGYVNRKGPMHDISFKDPAAKQIMIEEGKLGNFWKGSLDLTDPVSMDRFNAYVSRQRPQGTILHSQRAQGGRASASANP